MTNKEAIEALKRIRDEAMNEFIGDWADYEVFDIAIKALNMSNIKIPPMPKDNMIGYEWKLKWVLKPHPTITKVLIQGVNDESS